MGDMGVGGGALGAARLEAGLGETSSGSERSASSQESATSASTLGLVALALEGSDLSWVDDDMLFDQYREAVVGFQGWDGDD